MGDARIEAEVVRTTSARAERAARYDAKREAARLEFLEERGLLADRVRERDEIVSGQLFSAMDDKRKQEYVAGLDGAITTLTETADRLAAAVGDPETVVDREGWLPAERRALSLGFFRTSASQKSASCGPASRPGKPS